MSSEWSADGAPGNLDISQFFIVLHLRSRFGGSRLCN